MITLGVVGLTVSAFLILRYAFLIRDVIRDRAEPIYFEFAILGIMTGLVLSYVSVVMIWFR